MRNLFLLLLLANLGLLGWQRWISPEETQSMPVAIEQVDLPRLLLAQEVAPDEESEAVPVADIAGTTETADSEAADDSEAAGDSEAVAEVAESPEAAGETEGETEVADAADEPPAEAAPIEQAPVAAARAPEPAPDRCVSIGPFRDMTETAQALTALREAGQTPRQRLAEGEVWIGHWVYLPAFDSRAAARTVLNRLKENGITDSYIVPSGEERNAVSLGVFTERERARRRVAQIAALGYAPRVTDRHRSGAVYWIDTDLGPDETLEPGDVGTFPGRIMRLSMVDCPSGEAELIAGGPAG